MGLVCLCQGCGVQSHTLSRLLCLACGTFGFVHGALFFGRLLGRSDETAAAVSNNLRGFTGANATAAKVSGQDDNGDDDDVRCPQISVVATD
eukprot:COSAG05_NODE_3441_length_2060_cov_5.671144_5_plen_92_part_00